MYITPHLSGALSSVLANDYGEIFRVARAGHSHDSGEADRSFPRLIAAGERLVELEQCSNYAQIVLNARFRAGDLRKCSSFDAATSLVSTESRRMSLVFNSFVQM